MNSRLIVATLGVALCSTVAFAKAPTKLYPLETNDTQTVEQRRAELRKVLVEKQKAFLRETGGKVVKPGSVKGVLRFVNAQQKVPEDMLKKPVGRILAQHCYDLKLEASKVPVKGYADILAAKKASGADVAVVIVDLPDMPSLFVVPEERWAAVNVAKLGDAKLDMRFYSARVRKEMYRGFAFVTGAAASRYEGNLMDPISSVSDLDEHPEGGIPIDILMRIPDYLKKVGVTIGEWGIYRDALEEGWAPEPANEYQRNVKAKWEAEKAAKKGKPAAK